MKNKKEFILSTILTIIIGVIGLKNVNAESYTFDLIPYNVTNSCSVTTTTTAKQCAQKALDGSLDSYQTNMIEAGDTVMVLVNLTSSTDASVVYMNWKLNVEIDKLAYNTKAYWKNNQDTVDDSDTGMIPSMDNGGDWAFSNPSQKDNLIAFTVNDNATENPMSGVSGTLYAIFFKVSDTITSGTQTDITFDSITLSDEAMNELKSMATTNKLTLSVASNISKVGTLSVLKATGNNSLDYPFNFVADDDTKLEYNVTVPNAVNNIVLSGTPTDSSVKSVTNMNLIGGTQTFSAENPGSHDLTVGDNPINITVTAESGDVTVYKITVKRLSNDTAITSVTGTNGVSFTSVNETANSITVPYQTASSDITATLHDSNAFLDAPIGTWTINSDGNTDTSNTYSILVKSEECKAEYATVPGNDNCTQKTYPFEIIRTAPSKNVNLSVLEVDGVTVPGFDPTNDPEKKDFTLADVAANKTSVNITATVADPLSSVKIGEDGNNTQNLNVGDNTIKVTVTSEDGVTKKEYTLNIHRLSNDNLLAATGGLTVTSTPTGTLAPTFVNTFDASMGNYTYTFPANIGDVTVSATVKDTDKASVSIIDMSSSEAEDTSSKVLNTNTKTFPKTTTKVGVIVTAEDGTNRVYKIDFTRLTSSNNLLKSLSVTPGTGIKETFAPTTTSYTAEVDPEVTSVTVNYETQDTNVQSHSIIGDAGLTISGNDVSGLKYGPNTIKVHVVAENGQPIDYEIIVTRKMSSDAGLDKIRVGYNGATPTDIAGFSKTTYNYNLSTITSPLAYNTTSINIEFDQSNSESTVTGNVGTIDLTSFSGKQLVSDGSGKFVYEYTFKIDVDSQDHSNQETYTLKMYKEANNDVNTDTITVHGVSATLDPSDATNSTYKVEVNNNIETVAWNNINVTTHETTSIATAITTGTVNLSTTTDNTFDYLVTAENGDTKVFHIIITRKKSTNNTISRVNLYVGDEVTSTRFCEYTGSNTSCTIEVPTGTSKYRLEAVLPDGATMTPDSTTEYTMSASSTDSTQNRVLTIHPEDETAPTKDYTVVVKRQQSANNLLDLLETNAKSETMVDILGSDKVNPNRTISVLSSQTTVSIHAVAQDGTARITSNKYTGAAASDISFDVTGLNYGNNLVTITVTSETNIPKIYNLTIVREDNTEPRLSMITIDGNPIDNYLSGDTFDADPSKSLDDTNYTYNLNMFDNSVANITLGATSMDTENGTTSGTGQKDIETIYYGTTYDSGTIYTNTFVIRAFAHNKSIYRDYTINITRAANSEVEIGANDVAINYDGANHAATWNAANNRYEITVPNKVNVANSSNVKVTVLSLPGANDTPAKVTMDETTLKTDDETNGNVNTHKFTVTAEDGTQKEYTMQITRELSGNAFLKSISILNPDSNTDIGSWSPSFGDGITTYTVSVPVSTTDIKIDAELGESHQKIKDGDLKTVTLASSDETFTIEVTAENGHQETYTLKILREQSRINSLKSLKVKDTEGNEFVVNTHASQLNRFNVTVPGTIDKVVFEAVSDSALAEITYLGVDAGTTDTYSISTGTVTKEFTITSESGIEAKYYVEVTKLPKTDATLKKLAYKFNISDTEIEIPLQDGVYEYSIPDVANDIKTIIVSGETNDSDASITSGNTPHNLNTGENTIEIHTVAEDTTKTLVYKIKVNRAKNGNAYLKTLTVGTYTFDELIDFENTFNYTINVAETKDKLLASEILAEAVETTSSVTLEDNDLNLVTGDNIYHITVKAENDHEEHYTITVKKPASTNATLKEVKVTGGSLKETLSPTSDTYTIKVPFGTTSIEIEGIPTIDAATVDGNGTYNVADAPFTLTVHPEDTNAPDKTYTFNIEVAASTDATLNSLSVTGYPFTDGTNEVTFESNKENYSIGNIFQAVDKITVNAGASNPNATISYYYDNNEITSCHNNASCEITLDSVLGAKNVEVRVLAADGTTPKTYTIGYTKINSNNNKLSNIEAFDASNNSLSLSETFKPEVKSYKVSIPNELNSVRINVTKDDATSTVTINGEAVFTKTFNTLPEGTTTVTIKVTAQDGSEETYTVDIERAAYMASTDSELTDLKVMDVTDTTKEYALTPSFGNAADNHYSIGDIPFGLSSLNIVATKSDSKANIKYYVNDVEQTGNVVTLPNVSGTMKVEVTAEDNTTQTVYEIAYTKTPSTNAYLSGITVSEGTLDPAFGKEIYEYTVNLDNDKNSIDITATPEHSGATIAINGDAYTAGSAKTFDNLTVGETTINIVVTAEDGSSETYVVKVNRADVVVDEKITSVTFGHTIDDDYIRTVSDKTTGKDMKDQLDNDNSKLIIYQADGATEVTDTDLVGTGYIVKLIIDGVERDSKIIIIRGDVNGDCEVELFDAADIINHYLDTNPLTGVYLEAGDVNKDGEVELFDAADIINHYLDTAPIQFKD